MDKVAACVIARVSSTRMPKKVIQEVCSGYSMLSFIVQRLKRVKGIDDVIVCTSTASEDDDLVRVAADNGVRCFRGSLEAPIERVIGAGKEVGAKYVIRVTGDNVLTAVELLEKQIDLHVRAGLDYSRIDNLPLGATAEIVELGALENCYARIEPAVSEYMTLFIFDPARYKCGVFHYKHPQELRYLSLTVDTAEDMLRSREILKCHPDPLHITLAEVVQIIDDNNIPHAVISPDAAIRLPYDKSTTYAELLADLSARGGKARNFDLT